MDGLMDTRIPGQSHRTQSTAGKPMEKGTSPMTIHDTVYLKSGSPSLEIVYIVGDKACCLWAKDSNPNDLEMDVFPLWILTRDKPLSNQLMEHLAIPPDFYSQG
jgi:hypothetical protein